MTDNDLLTAIKIPESLYRCPWCNGSIGGNVDYAKAHMLKHLVGDLESSQEEVKSVNGWLAHLVPDEMLKRVLASHGRKRHRELLQAHSPLFRRGGQGEAEGTQGWLPAFEGNWRYNAYEPVYLYGKIY